MKRGKKTGRIRKSGKNAAVKRSVKGSRPEQNRHSYEETAILKVLQRQAEESIASRQLMRAAKLKDKEKFYAALHNLERTGGISVDKGHRVRYVSPQKDIQASIVSLSPGFGFAKPEAEGEDVFIHGSDLRGAFLGDSVLLTDVKKREKGYNGRVRKIIKRSATPVTGTVRIEKAGASLIPDGALRYPLKIGVRDLHGAKDGEKVTVVPQQDQRGDWRFAKVRMLLGDSESARVCADAIVQRYAIPSDFPQEVLEQAESVAAMKIDPIEISHRVDLRGKTIFTIDGADAKDLDDAISVEKIPSGYKLGVHIADVSHYITAGSALDGEAIERGNSVYFADRVIPMLPKAISNGICSLNPDTDKLTFSAFIYIGTDGEISRYRFQKSVISSKLRGVYSEVNEIFDGTASKEILKKYKPVKRALEHARALAGILSEKALERGEMEIGSSELKFVLDEKGVCVDVTARETGEAEGLIEQMMIAANRAAAMFALKNKLPYLYRVHGDPKAEAVEGLCELLNSMGIACKELTKNTVAAGDFAKVLERVKGTARQELVGQRILRTMDKARYSDEETGHFGLALKEYSHFTSPIRRYPDLVIHRILTDFLNGVEYNKIMQKYKEFTAETAVQTSKTEVRAVNAERAAEDCYSAEYMKAHIGEEYSSVISGMMNKGIFVRIPCGVEGFVNITDFKNTNYEFDGIITMRDRVTGKSLMVGDSLSVAAVSAEVSTGRVNFMPIAEG